MKTLFIALSLILSTNVFSQNISNTLGTNGVFTIKDASANFLTLSQTSGQLNILKALRLENTSSSTIGVILKGSSRFLHNFGNNNTFLGVNSGNFTMTGYDNIALGWNSLISNFSGYYNTAVGNLSLNSNYTGFQNTAVGESSLYNNTLGINNTAVGVNALILNVTGSSNTALGCYSLSSNTGSNNVALGYSTGSTITTGTNLTCIGYNAEPNLGSAYNQITLGNNQVTTLRCNVQSISSFSDGRDKKNITDLSLGLDFIMKVKPRLFNWDKREWYENNISDGSKMKEAPTAGFIAQELDEVQTTENAEWLNLVLKDNPEKLEATYGNLLPVMVKAIQELKSENDKLKQYNENLSSEVESLKSMNEKIVKLEKMVSKLTSVRHTSLMKSTEDKKISNNGDVK